MSTQSTCTIIKTLVALSRNYAQDQSKIVLLTTGSFNPVHQDHTRLHDCARSLVEGKFPSVAVVGSLLSPSCDSYVRPKYTHTGRHQYHISDSDRVELIKLALHRRRDAFCIPWETEQSEFIDFIDVALEYQKLLKIETDRQGLKPIKIVMVVGSDMLKCWSIFQNFPRVDLGLFVLERQGYPIEEMFRIEIPSYDEQLSTKMFFTPLSEMKEKGLFLDGISSTQICALVAKGEVPDKLLHPLVAFRLRQLWSFADLPPVQPDSKAFNGQTSYIQLSQEAVEKCEAPSSSTSTTTPVMLLTTGSFNPVHLDHVKLHHVARSWLETKVSNVVVIGSILSPSHNEYVAKKFIKTDRKDCLLDAEMRSQLIEMAIQDCPNIYCDMWEARRDSFAVFTEVLVHHQEQFDLAAHILGCKPIRVLLLVGSDLLKRKQLLSYPNQGLGALIIERQGHSFNDYDIDQVPSIEKQVQDLLFFVPETDTANELQGISSTEVCERVMNNENFDDLVHDRVARCLNSLWSLD